MFRYFLILIFSLGLHADLNKAYYEYSTGKYIQAAKLLNKIIDAKPVSGKDVSELSMAYFMKGVILSRLGNYEKAIESFTQIKNEKKDIEGLSYELAQALYAIGKLDKARIEFLNSVKEKYQIVPSLYYLAVIYKAMKDYQKAFYFLDKIHQLKYNKGNIKQLSWLQIAEIHLEQVNKAEAKIQYLKNVVLPSYQKALNFAPDSEIAEFIGTRINNLKVRYKMFDDKSKRKKNGKKIKKASFKR